MKKMIMTLMMVLSMTIGANAQKLDNTYSWRQGAYVHNIYAKYPTTPKVVPDNRVTKPMPQVNRPVTLPLINNERPVNVSTKRNPGNMTAKKEEPKRSFGSMKR